MDWVLPVITGIVGALLIIERRNIPRAMAAGRARLREHCWRRRNAMIKHEWSTARYYADPLVRRVVRASLSLRALLRRMGARS